MNRLTKFSRAIIAVAMMLAVCLPLSAHDFEVDGIYYKITNATNKTVDITYRGNSASNYSDEYSGNVTIPESVSYNGNTYSVTSIGDYAFYGCDRLTSVVIPNSVTSIGIYAFSGCTGLTSVTIGNSVTTIGSYAFYGCSGLTSVTIPNSVTSIGDRAFRDCTGLTEVTIGNSVTTIDYYVFDGCTGLTSVTIGNSVTSIYSGAFSGCTGLTSVTIPNSVTSIGDNAFNGCTDLTEVAIPISVISIGNDAFYDTGWYNKQPDGILYLDNCCLGYKGESPTGELMLNSNTRLIASGAFEGCTGLKSVTIGNSVASIGYAAFYNCGIRLIMCHCATPPVCAKDAFYGSYTALLMIPEGSLIDYALADEWHNFTQVHEVSEANVSTQKKSATFEIPTIEGADEYVASVYSDATMSQLVATTNYDAYGKITPMSTILELSIDGFDEGVYYYKVYVKSKKEGLLKVYLGTFEIELSGIEDIMVNESGVVEVERYDINGRLLSKPAPGINIIKMSDGTTRKEWVK